MAKRLTPKLKEKLQRFHNQPVTLLTDQLGELRARQKALAEEEGLIKTVLEAKLKSLPDLNLEEDKIEGERYSLQVINSSQRRFQSEKAKEFLTEEQQEQCYKEIPMTQYRTALINKDGQEEHPVEENES